MKLLLELLTLVLLFVLFRGAVRRFLPKRSEMQRFSPESLKALQRFRARYFRLLLLFIVIVGTALYFLLVFVKDAAWLHRANYTFYFPLKDSALWQASLLGGLLLGSLIAFSINRRMQRDGLSFYLEELQELAQGYQSFGTFRYLQYGIGLALFTVLTYSVLSTGLGLNKDQLTEVHPFGQYNQIGFETIKKLSTDKSEQLLINEKDSLDLSIYKYDSKELEDFLNQ